MAKYSKNVARKIAEGRLQALPLDEHLKLSKDILEHLRTVLADLHGHKEVQRVLSYKANQKWREVDVTPLESYFSDVRFDYVAQDARALFPSDAYDVILVPLYGFTTAGYRLGHGGGWYDQLLSLMPEAVKVGVGINEGRIDYTTEPHDIPMDIIVTEMKPEILQRRN